jgi:hypothetical protein
MDTLVFLAFMLSILILLLFSMMRLRKEEKWRRIRWRDTLIIMNVGRAINWYTPLFQIYLCFLCYAMDHLFVFPPFLVEINK